MPHRAMHLILLTLAALSAVTWAEDRQIHTPLSAIGSAESLSDRKIAVQGIFTVVATSPALVADATTYQTIGGCCGLQTDKMLILARKPEIWNVRERYEGATVIVRGTLKRQLCARRLGKDVCGNLPSLAPDQIEVLDRRVLHVAAKIADLPPVPSSSPEALALTKLADRTLEAVRLRDASKLTELFSPTVYADYGLDTFAEEFGPERVKSPTDIAKLYNRLLNDPSGRARWLYFSDEAGPSTRSSARQPYRFFTEGYPTREVSDAVICFARANGASMTWPNSTVALQTARTSDPYACFYVVKKQGRWWLDFERNYIAAGRVPPVP